MKNSTTKRVFTVCRLCTNYEELEPKSAHYWCGLDNVVIAKQECEDYTVPKYCSCVVECAVMAQEIKRNLDICEKCSKRVDGYIEDNPGTIGRHYCDADEEGIGFDNWYDRDWICLGIPEACTHRMEHLVIAKQGQL